MQQVQSINTWRMYGKVVENRIIVELPKNTDLEEVEIFIFPRKKKTIANKHQEWKDDFLTISQWDISENDIRLKSWQIPEF